MMYEPGQTLWTYEVSGGEPYRVTIKDVGTEPDVDYITTDFEGYDEHHLFRTKREATEMMRRDRRMWRGLSS